MRTFFLLALFLPLQLFVSPADGVLGWGWFKKTFQPVKDEIDKRIKQVEPMFKTEKVIRNSHPFQVQLRNVSSTHHFCGGTILETFLVLTAAHCVYDWDRRGHLAQVEVVAGIHHRKNAIGTEQVAKIHRVIFHEGYKLKNNHEDDLALLVIQPAFDFNDFVWPLQLVHFNGTKPRNAEISLWGKVRQDDFEAPEVPTLMNMTVWDDSSCTKAWKSIPTMAGLDMENMLCSRGHNKATCAGDSGSPLVCIDDSKRDDKRGYLCGVSSFGPPGCGVFDTRPGVFMDVSKYFDWIRTKSLSVRLRYCPHGYFRCQNDHCVGPQTLCDGNNDCGEEGAGSDEDEDNCMLFSTNSTERLYIRDPMKDCGYNVSGLPRTKLISHRLFCDSRADCIGEHDEQNCQDCNSGAFLCKEEGICISPEKRCNGLSNCKDSSDEMNCSA